MCRVRARLPDVKQSACRRPQQEERHIKLVQVGRPLTAHKLAARSSLVPIDKHQSLVQGEVGQDLGQMEHSVGEEGLILERSDGE